MGGGAGGYAHYQQRDEALEQIDTLLAGIPQYPGARLVDRHDSATRYRVSAEESIEAEPYASELHFELPGAVTGSQVQLHFRGVLAARRWRCTFRQRVAGVPYGFGCRRGPASLSGSIGDRGGYELELQASGERPPIRTVAGG